MMIDDIEDYFTKGCGRCARFDTPDCATKLWAPGLTRLRGLCRSAGLTETVKWGHPCYTHAGRNIVIIGALRDNFRLGFFDAALMTDPEAVLERQGPNTPHPDTIRFTANDAPETMAQVILAYLNEAKGHAEAGRKPPKDDRALALPEDLVDALDADPELATAFHALTPGRQKSYVITLNSAKQPATRLRRIETFRDRILRGKGANER